METRQAGAFPELSAEAHLKIMDDNRIATGVLSLTAPSVVCRRGRERRDPDRKVNEYVAEPVTKHPDRFGSCTTKAPRG